ncbi:hypothetical protein ACFL6S_24585 [Candidatus Poribacteria bacterium]
MNTENWRDSFRPQGYALFPNLSPKQLVTTVRQAMECKKRQDWKYHYLIALVGFVFAFLLMPPSEVHGRLVVRGNANDVTTFLDMLQKCTGKVLGLSADGQTVLLLEEPPIGECPTECPSFRSLLNRILLAPETIDIAVGRNQPGVLLDDFDGDGRGTVDLNDVEQFPEQPPPSSPNGSTRCQKLAHVFGEYWRAATNGIAPGPPGGPDPDYDDSHPVPPNNDPNTGIGAENSYRSESGQTTTVLSAVGVPTPGGGLEGRITFSDGTVEIWQLDGANITNIIWP